MKNSHLKIGDKVRACSTNLSGTEGIVTDIKDGQVQLRITKKGYYSDCGEVGELSHNNVSGESGYYWRYPEFILLKPQTLMELIE